MTDTFWTLKTLINQIFARQKTNEQKSAYRNKIYVNREQREPKYRLISIDMIN